MANIILVVIGDLALIGIVSLDVFISRDISGKRNKNTNSKNQDNE